MLWDVFCKSQEETRHGDNPFGLEPDGLFYFCSHTRSPDRKAKTQTPAWSCVYVPVYMQHTCTDKLFMRPPSFVSPSLRTEEKDWLCWQSFLTKLGVASGGFPFQIGRESSGAQQETKTFPAQAVTTFLRQ